MRQYVQHVHTQKYSTVGAVEGAVEIDGSSVGDVVGVFVLKNVFRACIVSLMDETMIINSDVVEYNVVLTGWSKEGMLETQLVDLWDSSMVFSWE